MKTILTRVLAWKAFVAAASLAWAATPERQVTFISTSDSHYREPDHAGGSHNDLNHASIEEINRIAGIPWPMSSTKEAKLSGPTNKLMAGGASPEKLGGDKIAKPRGVLLLGDVIDDGDRASNGRKISEEQYQFFLADFGLDGTDGLLKYPVFEGWGNHDGPPEGKEKNGFSFRAQLKKRNQVRKEKGLISNISENGLHYSWDWDDVHFVQLNIYPADKQREGVHYSPVWHDPQGALSFLKNDLAQKVGRSGRPVVLMAHCGFDTDWWAKEDWADLYQAAKAYNIVLYIYGHSGTGLRDWAPPGEEHKWTCINDGQTENGFFVIQITNDRLRAAFRYKTGLTRAKPKDGPPWHEWGGEWGWNWLLDRKLSAATQPAEHP